MRTHWYSFVLASKARMRTRRNWNVYHDFFLISSEWTMFRIFEMFHINLITCSKCKFFSWVIFATASQITCWSGVRSASVYSGTTFSFFPFNQLRWATKQDSFEINTERLYLRVTYSNSTLEARPWKRQTIFVSRNSEYPARVRAST